MRILQLIQKPQLRGAEIFACQLSLELQNQGIEVDLVYLFGNKPSAWIFPSLKIQGLKATERNRFWDFAAYRRLADIIKGGEYDLVQANAADTLKYAVLAKTIFGYGCPLVYRNANKMSDFFRTTLHRRLNQWLLAQCDYYISVSEKCRIDLTSIVKKAKERSVTISIGTHLFEEIEPIKRDVNGEPVIVNVGSLVPEKNHTFLIDIFHTFFLRYNTGYLWIIGDGALRPMLEDKIKSLGLEERVLLWGYKTEVIPILKSASVMVMPSKIEGMPAVILEAMSCHVPVIASDVGGISEIIKHQYSGFCIHSWEIADYLSCLEVLLFDEKIRTEIVLHARDAVATHYMVKDIARSFKNQYSQILKGNQILAKQQNQE